MARALGSFASDLRSLDMLARQAGPDIQKINAMRADCALAAKLRPVFQQELEVYAIILCPS